MFKKKAVLSIVFLLIAAMISLIGCGSSETTTSSENEAKSSDTSSDTALKPVQLTWYVIGDVEQKDTPLIEEEINKYIKDKINATVKINCVSWGSYTEKMASLISSKQEFDICFTSVWANDYNKNAINGAFLALNDDNKLLEKYAPKTRELLGNDFLAGSQINGKNYAIPANKEKAHAWGLLIRKDLVQKHNLDTSKITKLEDLEPLLKTIKETEPSVYPFEAVGGESPLRVLDWDKLADDALPGSLENDSKDMKVFNELERPETMNLLKLLHKWYKAGYIRPDSANISDYQLDQKQGKIFAAVRSLVPGKGVQEGIKLGYELVQVELTKPVLSNRETSGSMHAISSTSKNPERALMFLELVNTDKYLNNLVNFGIEKKHYNKVSEGVIEPIKDSGYNMAGLGWMFGNQFLNYLMKAEDPRKWSKYEEFNKAATKTKTLGFIFNPESVRSEVSECQKVWKEQIPLLETGTADPEVTMPKVISALKQAGLDKVIQEQQKQLDQWLASKK